MKNLRNKIILSGLVLLFALVATIGSTFAWFTVSNTVSVPAMQLNVQSSESLLIRVWNGELGNEIGLLDAGTYKANLSTSDILAATTAGYDQLGTFRLSPVTITTTQTSGAITPKLPYTMDVDTKAYTLLDLDTKVNSATGNVIDLKFWVMSQGTGDGEIVLENLSITASNTLSAQDAVVNAIKLAIWNSKEYNSGGATTPADPGNGSAKVFGLDKDYAFAFTVGMRGFTDDVFYWVGGTAGVGNISNISGTVVYTTSDDTTWTYGGLPHTYSGGAILDGALATEIAANHLTTTLVLANDAALNRISTANQTTLTGTQSMFYKSGATLNTNVVTPTLLNATVITALTRNVPALINVRIYAEGWDAQTTNAILAAIFSISFKFTLQGV